MWVFSGDVDGIVPCTLCICNTLTATLFASLSWRHLLCMLCRAEDVGVQWRRGWHPACAGQQALGGLTGPAHGQTLEAMVQHQQAGEQIFDIERFKGALSTSVL
jgi:hypothetical protein